MFTHETDIQFRQTTPNLAVGVDDDAQLLTMTIAHDKVWSTGADALQLLSDVATDDDTLDDLCEEIDDDVALDILQNGHQSLEIVEFYLDYLIAYIAYTDKDGNYLATQALEVWYEDLCDDPSTLNIIIDVETDEESIEHYEITPGDSDVAVEYCTTTENGSFSFSRDLLDYLPHECYCNDYDEDDNPPYDEHDGDR